MAVTVVIVDDHAAFRRSARAMLEGDGFVVVGEASDGPSGLEVVARLRPDVLLLDIQLPGEDGFAIAERLAERGDPPIVVFVSSRDRVTYEGRLAVAPAHGFIAKRDLDGAALSALIR